MYGLPTLPRRIFGCCCCSCCWAPYPLCLSHLALRSRVMSVDPQPGSLPLGGQAPPLSEGQAPERHPPPPSAALGRQKGDARTMFGSSIAGWHEGRTFVRKCVVIMNYRATARLLHLGLASVSPLRNFGTVVVVGDDDDDEDDAADDFVSSDVAAAKTHRPSSTAMTKWTSLLDFKA